MAFPCFVSEDKTNQTTETRKTLAATPCKTNNPTNKQTKNPVELFWGWSNSEVFLLSYLL